MEQVIVDGCISGSFRGWKHNSEFEIIGGGKWKQTDMKYDYVYSYMPNAKVIDKNGCYKLYVEGMSDCVDVKKG